MPYNGTKKDWRKTVLLWKYGKNLYVNVSDQTAIFTHETKMLISICRKYLLAFNVLNMTEQMAEYKTLKKKT